MLSIFKKMKWNLIITSLVMIAFGIVLAIYPEATYGLICNLIGAAIIGIGVFYIAHYFIMKIEESFYRDDFLYGLLAMLLGIIIIWKKTFFLELVPIIFGIIILASGVRKLQDGIDAKRLGYPQGTTSIILAAVSIILGILIITQPFETARFLFITIGFALIYSGISDLFNTVYLSAKIVEFQKRMMKEEAIEKEDIIDVPVEVHEIPHHHGPHPNGEKPKDPPIHFDD